MVLGVWSLSPRARGSGLWGHVLAHPRSPRDTHFSSVCRHHIARPEPQLGKVTEDTPGTPLTASKGGANG